jgi:outer membrane protein assembly factor BamA
MAAGRRQGAGPAAWVILAVCSAVAGCAPHLAGRDIFPEYARFSGVNIRAVHFQGTEPFTQDTLFAYVDTRPSRCRLFGLPICLPFTRIGREVHRLNLEVLRRDAERVALFYRRAGYYGTTVRPTVGPAGDNVDVTFFVLRGDPVYLQEFRVEGTEGILDPDSLLRTLPLQVGDLFDLGRFGASADQIERALLHRGHAFTEILRNFSVDAAGRRASAEIVAIPGPQVIVDSIIIVGGANLGRRPALRQLTFRPGDLLVEERLVESQRNLYGLELVQLATVQVAPTAQQLAPEDSTRATVIVTIDEAPVHLVEAAVGYGSVDCFRSDARWASRSFLGGARRLAISGSVSKIGIAAPADFGFEGNICRGFRRDDPFRRDLDYRFVAELNQPWFVSPRNNLTASLFSQRQSEPRIYQREAHGGSLALVHRFGPRAALTASIDARRGRTLASEAIFCLALQLCLPADIQEMQRRRWRNTLSLSGFRDRTDNRLDPARGYDVRSSVTVAARPLGSDLSFRRWTGDASAYLTVQPHWVAAFRLRLGTIFGGDILRPGRDFLPPEERFFAGGATSVRGFERNTLGPGVYVAGVPQRDPETGELFVPPGAVVRFVPVGGTALALANAELRLPSPVFRETLRWAVFLDVGAVGTEQLWDLDLADFRFTPGLGVRLQTPIGPARMDVGYSPYGPPIAPLLVANPDLEAGGLIRLREAYRPAVGFWGRFRVHLAVGQAF